MNYHMLESDGFLLDYSIQGEGQPAIVIGSARYYEKVFSQSIRKHLQLVFMDHRAFGQAPVNVSEEVFELEYILSDIEKLRTHLQLNKVVIIGHSIHAFMAMEYAKKFPDAVSSVVLIASSPMAAPKEAADRYFGESVWPERHAALAKKLSEMPAKMSAHPDQAFIIRMLTFSPMLWYDLHYDESWLWEDVSVHPVGAAKVWGSMFAEYDITHNIDKMVCPIFLALGRYDYFNPPHLWEPVRARFSDLTIRVFERSGHTPQLEESQLFDAEICKWLKV